LQTLILNAIKNNLAASKLIAFYNGIPTEESKRHFEQDFISKRTGTDNAGRILFVYSDSRERNVDVIDLSGDNLDKRYAQLNATVQQEIFTAHKVTSPMLFGIKTEGQLGGRDELDIASELFKDNYIRPRKLQIMRVFRMMASQMGYTGNLDLLESDNILVQTKPVQQKSFYISKELELTEQEKRLLKILSKYGRPRSEFDVIETRYQWYDDLGGAVNNKTVKLLENNIKLSLIHISEPTRPY